MKPAYRALTISPIDTIGCIPSQSGDLPIMTKKKAGGEYSDQGSPDEADQGETRR